MDKMGILGHWGKRGKKWTKNRGKTSKEFPKGNKRGKNRQKIELKGKKWTKKQWENIKGISKGKQKGKTSKEFSKEFPKGKNSGKTSKEFPKGKQRDKKMDKKIVGKLQRIFQRENKAIKKSGGFIEWDFYSKLK